MVILPFLAGAQLPPNPKQFDVVSVKPYEASDGNFMIRPFPGGSFRAVGVTLKMLMMFAFGVKAFQVSDAPGWTQMDLWDIQAKAEGMDRQFARAEAQEMVRSLLADRFQLRFHRDIRKMAVYALVATKAAGRKLAPPTSPGAGICPCTPRLLAPARASMAMLADQLSAILWRVVIDQTGIKGEYSFRLEWTPAPGEYGAEALGLPRTAGLTKPPEPAYAGPSISTALKEQLGLRLESRRGPVEVIVVDRVRRPTEN